MPDHPDANVESAATSASNLLNSAPITDKDTGNQVHAAAAEEQRKKSGIRSVRDAFKNAASRVGDTADRLKSAVGAGKGTEEFEKARKRYKECEKELKDFTDIPLKIVDLAMDGKVAPLERFPQKKETYEMLANGLLQEMANLRKQHPGIERSRVGQAVHQGVKKAAQSIGNKLRS